MKKRFLEWFGLKRTLHEADAEPPMFNDGEIWWCAMGENVGIEVNGKDKPFSRPIFIYKKLSRQGFMGIPLTTSKKTGSWYVEFDFQGKTSLANLAQARVLSAKRLYNKMGDLDDNDAAKISEGFVKLYSNNKIFPTRAGNVGNPKYVKHYSKSKLQSQARQSSGGKK